MHRAGKARTCVRRMAALMRKNGRSALLYIAVTSLVAAFANHARPGFAGSRGALPAAPVLPAVSGASTNADSGGILDWAGLARYREANVRLGPPPKSQGRVVFFGDSITEFWPAQGKFFPGRSYIDRGISGQCTGQMLLRFQEDVIALRPRVVVILAGINDIAGNAGPSSPETILANIVSMAELARANGIRPVLSSITPAKAIPWSPGVRPVPEIALANRLIRGYCERNGIPFIDYFSAMAGQDGGMKPGLSHDGVHPNAAGYAVMEPLAEKALLNVLSAGI